MAGVTMTDKHAPPPAAAPIAPAPGTGEGTGGVSDKVAGLLDRLTPDLARSLYEEVRPDADHPTPDKGRDIIRRALVGKLNVARHAHARRQFTELFEPYLTPHAWLLGERYGAPGVVHALDVGGLWSGLVAKSLGPLARKVDAALAAMAQEEPLYLLLRRPEALALKEELRVAAAQALAAAMKDHAAALALLQAANTWRAREAGLKELGVEPRALTSDDLSLFLAILASGQAYVTAAHLAERGASGGWGGRMGPDPSLNPEHRALLNGLTLLATLDRHRDYPGVLAHLMDPQTAIRAGLPEAINRHLSYVCHRLAALLARLAGAEEGARRPLMIAAADKRELELELGHLDSLLALCDQFDMLGASRMGALARDTLGWMIQKIERALYPYLTTRVIIATQARGVFGVDHAALAWMLDFVSRWRAIVSRGLHWGMAYGDFRDHVMEELVATFRAAFIRADRPARDRLVQAARAAELADALGVDLRRRMTLLDRGLVQTARECLLSPDPLTGTDHGLLRAITELATRELERTRHWRDPALADFVALARARLSGADRRPGDWDPGP